MVKKNLTQDWLWNIFLITAGSIIFSIGIKGIVIHNDFITGGIFGSALLLYYKSGLLSPSLLFFLLNVPLFFVGWFMVSRRFFLYSLYGTIVVTAASQMITLDFHIQEQLYAAVAGGIVCGAGSGIVLRSLGSGGGLDIIAVILFSRFNIGVGKVYLGFNIILFSFAATFYSADTFIASVILVFIASLSLEQVMTLFNQRKIVYVISDRNERIAESLREELSQGATFIKGKGAYSGADKLILMAITNNIQLKKLESLVFEEDENALFIVENSFNVLGTGFGRRKIY